VKGKEDGNKRKNRKKGREDSMKEGQGKKKGLVQFNE
jgi:hypothetical protein